jgi:predicted Zn-dependent protease
MVGDQPDDELSADIQKLVGLIGTDPRLAEDRARELLKEHPQEPGILLLLAMSLRRKGDVAGAVAVLNPLVMSQPAMAAAHYELGMALIAQGKNPEATRHIVQAVELDPNHVDAWNVLGDQLTRMRRKRGADAAYAKAFSVAVEDPRLRDAVAFLQQDKPEEAERLLREILVADPKNVTALKLMAELCIRAERFRAAETLLARCLELAPDFLGARYRYVTVLLLQNKLKMTMAQLNELSKQDPDETYYCNLKAVTLTRMSDFEGAAAEYAAVLKNDPNQPGVWISYGNALNVMESARRRSRLIASRSNWCPATAKPIGASPISRPSASPTPTWRRCSPTSCDRISKARTGPTSISHSPKRWRTKAASRKRSIITALPTIRSDPPSATAQTKTASRCAAPRPSSHGNSSRHAPTWASLPLIPSSWWVCRAPARP